MTETFGYFDADGVFHEQPSSPPSPVTPDGPPSEALPSTTYPNQKDSTQNKPPHSIGGNAFSASPVTPERVSGSNPHEYRGSSAVTDDAGQPPSPVTPVPEGDDLDELVLDCARALVTFPRMQKHLHYTLKVSSGRYPDVLLNEVTFWIQRGNLRDKNQVNRAMSAYCDYQERLVAFGVVSTEWEMASWNLRELRRCFRIPDAKPWPSKAEIIAAQKQAELDREQQFLKAERDKENDRRIEREIENADRVERLPVSIALRFWPLPRVGHPGNSEILTNDETVLKRSKFNDDQQDAFVRFQEQTIREAVEAGKTDEEIFKMLQEAFMQYIETQSGTEWGSCVPEPLQAGERRKFVEPQDYVVAVTKAVESLKAGEMLTVNYCIDGRFCITVGPDNEGPPEATEYVCCAHGDCTNEVEAEGGLCYLHVK